jgi:phosphoribosylamine--glycine ligase
MEDVPEPSDNLRIYYAAVDQRPDGLFLTGSRAVAFVGIGNDLEEAQRIAEDAASRVKPVGLVRHRKDIGTWGLVQKRIDHVKEIAEKRNAYPFSYEERGLSPVKAR